MQRYRARISGPLLDRIDLRVELGAPELDELAPRAPERSPADPRGAELAERVARARAAIAARQGPRANADLTADELDRCAALEPESRRTLERAVTRRGLSARGAQSVRRVARTLADLEACAPMEPRHLAQALALRSPLY